MPPCVQPLMTVQQHLHQLRGQHQLAYLYVYVELGQCLLVQLMQQTQRSSAAAGSSLTHCVPAVQST